MTRLLFSNAKGQIPMSFLYSKNVLLHVIIITILLIFIWVEYELGQRPVFCSGC